MDILCVDLDDNNNFDEDDPDIIIHLKPVTWRYKLGKWKQFKKIEGKY